MSRSTEHTRGDEQPRRDRGRPLTRPGQLPTHLETVSGLIGNNTLAKSKGVMKSCNV
jgi:hypothetical protein